MKARKVDPLNNPEDFRCLFLGSLGLSTSAIIKATELSPGQIVYRLHKFRVKRKDYRNGEGEASHYVLAKVTRGWARELETKLRGAKQITNGG